MKQDKLASLISLVSNAPVIAFFSFLTLLLFPIYAAFPLFLLIAALFGTVIPLTTIYYLYKKKHINDFYSSDRASRWLAFLLVTPSYFVGAFLLLLLNAPEIVSILMLCYVANSIVAALITLKWKISVHLIGLAGPVTILAANFGSYAWLLLLFALPIGWSRIRLKMHNTPQVVAGVAVGIALTAIQLFVYLSVL
ncbi:MAG: hypothetical protein KGH60_04685 [Candidatus Micrarchaeota archaeon]|nr:hypothetical protein [Candidatus Micrarchaeota archaeon]